MLHGACLHALLEKLETPAPESADILIVETPEEYAASEGVLLHFFESEEEDLTRETRAGNSRLLSACLEGVIGRKSEEWFREVIFVSLEENRLSGFLTGKAGEDFMALRRKALRSAVGRERRTGPPGAF